MSRKSIVGVFLVLLLIILVGAYLLLGIKRSIALNDPGQYPLQTAQWLVNTSLDIPNELTPTPASWEIGIQQCRDLIRPLLASNDAQYTIEIMGAYGDNGTPIYSNTGSDEILLHVVFPDGRRVELYFYALNLSGCRDIIDND